MSDDFSLIGIESVPVAEYLPILEKIKHDLKCIYEKSQPDGSMSFNLESIANSNAPTEETLRNVTNQMESDPKSLIPESERQIVEQLQRIVLLIPNKSNEKEDQLFSLLETVELYIKSKTDTQDESNNVNLIGSLNQEFESLKKEHSGCEIKINRLRESLERYRDQLRINEENIQNLTMNNEKLREKEPAKPDVILRKHSADREKVIQDQIQTISNLESKIKTLEMKDEENQKNIEIISELENRIKVLLAQEENDENYEILLANLKAKKTEVRERDLKIENLESEISGNEMKIKKLEKEINRQKNQLTETKNELEELERSKEDLDKRFKMLLREHRVLEKKAADGESNADNLEEIKSLKVTLKKEESASRNKDKTIDNLKEEIEKNKMSTIKSRELERELQKCKLESEEKIKALEAKNAEELEKKTSALTKMRMKIKEKNEEKVDSVELKKLNAQLNAKDAEFDHLNEKYKNINAAYDKAFMDNELAKKENHKLKLEIENMKKLHLARAPVDGRKENVNVKKPETNPFPDWWQTHMNK